MSEHSLMLIKIIEGIREENYLFIAPLKYVRKTKENPEGIEMIIRIENIQFLIKL